ncbi:tripartite tricarboxylate transporter substrate binding protein [Roseomonas terrae]|jgi:tripartite-type tricarboxylate transporter receptor subunit TctC|uniref:Tripartite tricarboxylate transporter substrate binding protein n=1 Tax=Neoroseomonas terrae TaxID=424799 RepID=A0ABS5EC65_9PROT|nr:tripartite tricarboxylate transporter substrate binding protein [Neoroseomonas terrae]MBR0648622.1 tripartite tricarboxylate transporter substrate binding protein [Neoroseomonas terrae]
MIRIDRRRLLAGAAVLTATPFAARAQEAAWPSRPIKYIVPYTPGGGSDIVSRLVTATMSGLPGGPQFVIENRPGAGGNIGVKALADSPPDGYTIGVITIATHGVNPTLYPNLPFDPVNDFTMISQLNLQPVVIAVNANSPIRTLGDLLRNTGPSARELTFGSAGNGLSGHAAGELLRQRAGVRMIHVPYRGSSGAWADLLGGRIDLIVDNVATAVPHAQSGRARILGVSSRQPMPGVDAPTIGSLVPGFVVDSWNVLAGPKGMPMPIVNRLAGWVGQAMEVPALRARYAELNLIPPENTSPEFAATFVRQQIAMWAPVVREAGMRVD